MRPQPFHRRLIVISLFGLTAGAGPLFAKDGPLKALLVCGGCCHDYKKQSEILRDGIQARANVQVDVVISTDAGTSPYFPMYESKDWAKGYDVVIHDECSADIKDMNYVRNITDAHKNGLPAVNLHCAMHSYRTGTDIWFEYLGLQSSGHGAQIPIAIDFNDEKHPVTEGMKDWTTGPEELYNNVKVFGKAKPLALGTQKQGSGKEDTAVVVWTNDYNGTKIFNTTLGHNNATVGDERYLQLVVKGLLWSCGKLNAEYLKPYKGPAGKLEILPPKGKMPKGPAPANATVVTPTVSSQQDENPMESAVDGDPETRWCGSSGDFPQWYQMEFEKPREFSGVKVIWESGNRTYQYKLEVSNDGKEWKTVADQTKNTKGGETSDSFGKLTAKFLKVTCTGSSQGGWASIREISLDGGSSGPLYPKGGKISGAGGGSGASGGNDKNQFKDSGNSKPEIVPLSPERERAVLADVKVADGFDVTLFANSAAANYPVYVASAPNGDLYVASDGNGSLGRKPQRGRIVRLRDTDKDGKADQVTEFVSDVDSPRGMVWDNDRLYVIHPPDISVFIDKDRDGVSDEKQVLIKGIAFGFADRPADHTTNGLSLGIDGWLYISGGDFGFKDAVGTDGRHLQHRAGGVIRFRPDGTGLEIFSTGTRNILGTPISPLLDLFARDNTNDGGGWDVRFHHFTGLEDHGYPRMYINFGEEIVQPLADYGGGSGCGSMYLSEPGFPAGWNNAPLTCDWGTNALWHHSVEPSGATFKETAKPKELIKMTRPTDADVDGMSGIYQASWKGATFDWEGSDVGYVVRVTPKGYTPEPLPNFNKASEAELVKLLESPSQVRTLEAQRELLRRPGTASMRDGLVALAKDSSKELPARVAALYALTQRAVKSTQAGAVIPVVAPLAADPKLQRFVLRALSDAGLDKMADGRPTAPAEVFTAGLKSEDPRTRLEAIIGVARQNLLVLAPQVAASLGHSDPVIAHTAFRALAKMQADDACFALLDNASTPPAQKHGAALALMRMHTKDVVKGLLQRLSSAKGQTRDEVLAALCRLHFTEGEWKGDSWGTRPDTRGPYYQPEEWSETAVIAKALKAELENGPVENSFALRKELRRNRIQFDESLGRTFEMVKKDPKLLPALVEQLSTAENLPGEAVPYLVSALKGDYPSATMARAIGALSKTDSDEGCTASLAALEKLRQAKDAGAGKAYEGARREFLTSKKLENKHQLLEKVAEQLDGAASVWADAGLLALGARKDGSPESRELSKKATDHGWEDAKRRAQLVRAAGVSGFRGLDDKVVAALKDSDATVASAAKDAAVALKLGTGPQVEDKTPIVGTLKPEEIIPMVLKEKGDAAVGERMFNRQSCATCHAVSKDEAQKGPFLGNIAQTYSRADLATNIIDPGKTIAQGFATEMIALKDGTSQMVFITLEGAEEVKARNIAGQEFSWKTGDITKREKLPVSMMPPGLASGMTVREFASLLEYLEGLSKK